MLLQNVAWICWNVHFVQVTIRKVGVRLCFFQMRHDQGHRLFVVSNKPRHISLQILEREGMATYFEAVITRDSRTPSYSGKREMIETLLAERGILAEDCLMVGDTG